MYQLYTDGSYKAEDKRIGWGWVLVQDGIILKEGYGGCLNDEMERTRNVGGELKAVIEGVTYCEESGIKEIDLFYDYFGVEKWVTGEWMCKKELTLNYKTFMSKLLLRVSFIKVKAHSGVLFNDRADILAKLGANYSNI